MKKILIVSYYFHPYTNIAHKRLYYFARSLMDNGYDVMVMTRQYNGNEKLSEDININSKSNEVKEFQLEGMRVIAVPYRNSVFHFLSGKRNGISKFLLKIYLFLTNLFGILQIDAHNNTSFKKHLKILCKSESFDYALLSSPPSNMVGLAAWIYSNYKTKIIIDFRDYFYRNKLRKTGSLPFFSNLFYHIQRFHIQRFMNSIRLKKIIVASKTIGELLGYDATVILNGYAETDKIEEIKSSTFEVSYTGTIYPSDDFRFIIDGFTRFLQQLKSTENIRFNFIGTDNLLFEEFVGANKYHANYSIQNQRIPSEELKKVIERSSILLSIGWDGWKGIYTGKFFEYLGYKKCILLAPNDHDVLEDLLNETHAGRYANTPNEMAEYLMEWYKEWTMNGKITCNHDAEAIQKYSRKSQNQQLSNLFGDHF